MQQKFVMGAGGKGWDATAFRFERLLLQASSLFYSLPLKALENHALSVLRQASNRWLFLLVSLVFQRADWTEQKLKKVQQASK